MAEIIDGKLVSTELRAKIKTDVSKFISRTGITPALAVILVGDDPASAVYVRNKHKACIEAGMRSIEIKLPATTDEAMLLDKIDELNRDASVHGIVVEPMPPREAGVLTRNRDTGISKAKRRMTSS